MHTVEGLFVGSEYATQVWICTRVTEDLEKERKHRQKVDQLLKKVKYWAEAGFSNFEGGEGYPIKHEWDGVYRLGTQSSLYRFLGIYGGDKKDFFLILAAFLKRQKKLGADEKQRIDRIAEVKKRGQWKKKEESDER